MTAPEGKRAVRVARAALHNPCTKEEYAEIVWETVEERFVFVTNVAKYSGGCPNQLGVFATRRWATRWDGESFAELVANARRWAEESKPVVVFENGVPGRVVAEKEEASDTSEEGRSAEDATPQPTLTLRLVVDLERLKELPDDVPYDFESARALFEAVTAKTDKNQADKVWTLLAARIGPRQSKFDADDWSAMIQSIRQLRSCTVNLNKRTQ